LLLELYFSVNDDFLSYLFARR